jgi:phosphoserine phosphatase
MAEENLLIVNISGPDRPGIIAAFAKVLQNHQIEIKDIQQASLLQTIGLHMLLKFEPADQSKDSAIKDLLFAANQLDLKLNFQLLEPDQIKRISQTTGPHLFRRYARHR